MATKVEVTKNNFKKQEMEIKLTNKAKEEMYVQIKQIKDTTGCDRDTYNDPSYSLNYTVLDDKKKKVGDYNFYVGTYAHLEFLTGIQIAAEQIKKRNLDSVEAKVLTVASKAAIADIEKQQEFENQKTKEPINPALKLMKKFFDR